MRKKQNKTIKIVYRIISLPPLVIEFAITQQKTEVINHIFLFLPSISVNSDILAIIMSVYRNGRYAYIVNLVLPYLPAISAS